MSASLASLYYKGSTPQPPYLVSSISSPYFSVHQYLDVWDMAQPVLDGFQVGHLITTMYGDLCIQAG